MASAANTDPKLAGFTLIQANYKQVNNHRIRADFLIPQPASGKSPVILRFHGGGLITGDSLFLDWFPQWTLDLAQKHGAVIASPNYRLMPESTSLDVFDDLEDFWAWIHSPEVAGLLSAQTQRNPVELDFDRVLTAGESAGGLLSVSFALSHAEHIRAATAAYPNADMTAPHFNTPKSEPLMGFSVSESVMDEHIASISEGDVLSSAFPPTRLDLMLGDVQHGTFNAVYDRGTENSPGREVRYPRERLEVDPKIPRGGIVIVHGKQDDVVPAYVSERFVRRARELTRGRPGGDKIVLALREGGHGFDGMARLDEEWLQESLKRAVEEWLA